MSLKQATADLQHLPDDLFEAALEGILQIAELVKGLAQINVRVDTGTLRDTGRIERGGKHKYWTQVSVRFGGYRINPKTGKICDYAVIVEQRYPYLKPAWEQVRPEAEYVLRNFCLQAIKRVESHGVLNFT